MYLSKTQSLKLELIKALQLMRNGLKRQAMKVRKTKTKVKKKKKILTGLTDEQLALFKGLSK